MNCLAFSRTFSASERMDYELPLENMVKDQRIGVKVISASGPSLLVVGDWGKQPEDKCIRICLRIYELGIQNDTEVPLPEYGQISLPK